MPVQTFSDYYYYTQRIPEPAWMRIERYAYCDSYVDGMMTQRTRRKKFSIVQSVLGMLLHI